MVSKQTTKTISSITVGNPIRSVEPKTIAAVVLVALMAVLWVRVLMRSKPNTASAMTTGVVEQIQPETTRPDVKIRALPLPVIAGRHDTIADDFFKADRCSAWNQNAKTVPAAEVSGSSQSQKIFNELVKAVTLEAIIKDAAGNAEKACINGAIVSAGSALQVSVRNEIYSVHIVAIEPGRVRWSWQDHSIEVEMPDQKVN